ncbi:ankyrin repeat domain-containing protein SOWAHC [Megalops cyprinoides]|uniref:ankyrin repeat domain-containing protein SOWAHC n=1 Tax=Megalops cyprinoides TaxID=118141 RepID=UPI001863A519|nr:ankyrin repeat domain-containing protein SOWAHC [Megalops cyprinoides]
MATECTQEAVLQFLTERGGRVKNVELIDHFKLILPSDPGKKALVKEKFKGYVDNVAFVKLENGVKFVCLKKKYRGSVRRIGEKGDGECNGNGITAGNTSFLEQSEGAIINNALNDKNNCFGDPLRSTNVHEENSNYRTTGLTMSTSFDGDERRMETVASDDAKQEILPGSGYRTDKRKGVEAPSDTCASILEGTSSVSTKKSAVPIVCVSRENSLEMGNTNSCSSVKASTGENEKTNTPEICIPQIAVIEASPLPTEADGTVFNLPGEGAFKEQHSKTSKQINPSSNQTSFKSELQHGTPTEGVAIESKPKASEDDIEGALAKGAPLAQLINRRRVSRGSQRSLLSSNPSEDGADEGQLDSASISGSDSNTPKSSRKNFIELMMNSSPQVRRSMVHRNSTYLSARHRDRDSVKSDSDSASLVSSTTDEDGGSVTLDPLEHEWMMCASDGQWESLHRLLTCEPNLVMKKDFVTGFTCLHWAAKQGKQELLALLVNFAKQHAVPVNINARSSAGYTPLHLAAMHNHIEVVKLLVGAYDADVEARDYSGKKAAQYLTNSVAEDIRDIVGAEADPYAANLESGAGRWRLSKVLPSNLMPLKLLNHPEEDACDGGGLVKSMSVYRKSSMSKMKPRLHKIRFRTQIIHSTSFRETEEGDRPLKSPVKSRPISNLFG